HQPLWRRAVLFQRLEFPVTIELPRALQKEPVSLRAELRWKRGARDPGSTASCTRKGRVIGPHRPIARANSEVELFGHSVGQDRLNLHTLPGARVVKESLVAAQRLPQQMIVSPAHADIRQVGDIARNFEAVCQSCFMGNADT